MSYKINLDSTYTAIALEQFDRSSKGKFYIPALFPILSSSSPYNTSYPSKNMKTKNSVSLPISSVNISNYIELYVPDYVANDLPKVPETYGRIIAKGAQVQIIFNNGDITRPKIIATCD